MGASDEDQQPETGSGDGWSASFEEVAFALKAMDGKTIIFELGDGFGSTLAEFDGRLKSVEYFELDRFRAIYADIGERFKMTLPRDRFIVGAVEPDEIRVLQPGGVTLFVYRPQQTPRLTSALQKPLPEGPRDRRCRPRPKYFRRRRRPE